MNIGDKAPERLGVNENGEEILLSNYRGKKVVLYFYPKDNTSGCTAEACSLRDHYAEFRSRGYEVIGVSVDSAASHRKFIDKYEPAPHHCRGQCQCRLGHESSGAPLPRSHRR